MCSSCNSISVVDSTRSEFENYGGRFTSDTTVLNKKALEYRKQYENS